MKLGGVTMAFRDEGTIRGTLACLAPHVERHFVLLQDKPFYGECPPPDKTEAICAEFPNVEVIKGNWPEHVLRNIGIELCKQAGCDWMIGFDADEMMTGEDIEKLKLHLAQTKYDAVGFISKVYWHSPQYRFEPDPDHCKVCVTRIGSRAKYVDMQCVNVPYECLNYRESPHITHHHLSYAAPKDILAKVIHYNHANQVSGKEWYEKYFKNWRPGDDVYQPFMTKWKAVFDPLPEELVKCLGGETNAL